METLKDFFAATGEKAFVGRQSTPLSNAIFSGLTAQAAMILAGHQRKATDPQGFSPFFAFFDRPEFNAVAWRYGATKVIGVNAGYVARLRRLFRAMSVDDPIINGKSLEACTALDAARFPWPIDLDAELAAMEDELQNPLSEPIEQRIDALLEAAFIFVVGHEVTHLFNGHVDWMTEHFKVHAVDELNVASTPGLRGIDMQTLEMDADMGAADVCLMSILGLLQRTTPPFDVYVQPDSRFGGAQGSLIAYGLALGVVFEVFHQVSGGRTQTDLEFDTHPPATFRALTFFSKLAMDFAGRTRLPHDKTFERWLRGFMLGQRLYPASAIKLIDLSTEAGRDAGFRHHRLLLKNWANLRPQLDQVKYGGTLADIQVINDEAD